MDAKELIRRLKKNNIELTYGVKTFPIGYTYPKDDLQASKLYNKFSDQISKISKEQWLEF